MSKPTVDLGSIRSAIASVRDRRSGPTAVKVGAPARVLDADFEESDHPRASNGQFGKGGAGPVTVKPKSGQGQFGAAVRAFTKGTGTANTGAAQKIKAKLETRSEAQRTTKFGPTTSGGDVRPGVLHVLTETNHGGDTADRVLGAFRSKEDARNRAVAHASTAERKGEEKTYRTTAVRHDDAGSGRVHIVLGQGDGYGSRNHGEDAQVAGVHAEHDAAVAHQRELSEEAWRDAGYDEPHPGVEKANERHRQDGELGGFTVHRVPITAPRGSGPMLKPKRKVDLLSLILGSAAHDASTSRAA